MSVDVCCNDFVRDNLADFVLSLPLGVMLPLGVLVAITVWLVVFDFVAERVQLDVDSLLLDALELSDAREERLLDARTDLVADPLFDNVLSSVREWVRLPDAEPLLDNVKSSVWEWVPLQDVDDVPALFEDVSSFVGLPLKDQVPALCDDALFEDV